MSVQTPIDYTAIRKALVAAVQSATELTCVEEEENIQNVPRPTLPYVSFKIITPGIKTSDDSIEYVSGTTFNRGGQRRMTVSFHCYAPSSDAAYKYMGLWQASLEMKAIQEALRKKGIAVWTIGNVADLSKLLNTGYEKRTHMDVQFGISSNLTEDLGAIETAKVDGSVDTVSQTKTVHISV